MNLWLLAVEPHVVGDQPGRQRPRSARISLPSQDHPVCMGLAAIERWIDQGIRGLAAVAMLLGKADVIYSRRPWRTKAIG
jgi:hypothetical protein